MRVVRYLDKGRSKVSLVCDDWVPISYHTTIYLNQMLGSITVNSKERIAYELKFFLRWLEVKKIDLIERVSTGIFLQPAEAHAFTQAVKMRVGTALIDNIIKFNSCSDKQLSNAIHAASVQKERVKPTVTNGRILTAIEYIEFLHKEIHCHGSPPSYVNINCVRTISDLTQGKLKVSSASKTSEQARKARSPIPEDIFNKLLEIIDPSSAENPFKHSKLRNSLIVKILITTGIRRGALSKLKISNCDFTGDRNFIYTSRTPDDIDDPRKHKPSQKTQEHASFIESELMSLIDYYIENKRSRFQKSAEHEFVFISEMSTRGVKGSPLTLGSINYILKVLSKALSFNLHPHLLRYKWNERFTVDTEGMPEEEVAQLRRYAMGWSRDSQMASLYNEFKISQKVREIQNNRQLNLMRGSK
jgi:integrase